MSIQRATERKVRGLLRTMVSRMTLKMGEVKLITMRSPIGIMGTAITIPKVMVAVRKPWRHIKEYSFTLLYFESSDASSKLTFFSLLHTIKMEEFGHHGATNNSMRENGNFLKQFNSILFNMCLVMSMSLPSPLYPDDG